MDGRWKIGRRRSRLTLFDGLGIVLETGTLQYQLSIKVEPNLAPTLVVFQFRKELKVLHVTRRHAYLPRAQLLNEWNHHWDSIPSRQKTHI